MRKPDGNTFTDRDTERRALAFLLVRFSGRVLRNGEHIVPEAALQVLADQGVPFLVQDCTNGESGVDSGPTSPA